MKITLTNIQSWKDGTLSLPNGTITIPYARNNYGKSVPVNSLLHLLYGNFAGIDTSKGILRNGYTQGAIRIFDFDGEKDYIVNITRDQYFHRLYDPSSKTWKDIIGKPAPPAVLDYLGWSLSTPPIIDLDWKFLFIRTNAVENFEFCRPLLTDPSIEEKLEELQEGIKRANSSMTTSRIRKAENERLLASTPLQDISELQEEFTRLNNKLERIQSLKPVITLARRCIKEHINYHYFIKERDKKFVPPILSKVLLTLMLNEEYQRYQKTLPLYSSIPILKKGVQAVYTSIAYITDIKNLELAENRIKAKKLEIERAKEQIAEEDRKYMCPQCGYDLRTHQHK